jgi:hypothetical protein
LPTRSPQAAAAVAGLGFVLGLGLWFFAWRGIAPAGSLEETLKQAQELGLSSATLREGYDKGQELKAWLLGSLLVPGGLLLGWFVASRSRPGARGRADSASATSAAARADAGPGNLLTWKLPWLVVALTALAVAVRPGLVHGPSPWGTFGLLGEEGVYLGAIQALRSGRSLYANLHFPYGPLLIQPLQVWLAIVGDTVVSARAYVLLLHGVGVAGLALTLRLALGRSAVAHWSAAGGAVALAALAPTDLSTLNSALLRPVLAFLPVGMLLAGLRWRRTLPAGSAPRLTPFHLAGGLVAVAALVSLEVGSAAAAGLLLALALGRLGRSPWLQTVTGFGVMLAVALAPMALDGGLRPFVEQAMSTLRLSALGYQSIPYPDPLGLFVSAEGLRGTYRKDALDAATALWCALPPLLIWLALGIGAAGTLGRPLRQPGLPLLCIGASAAVLFRAALGRSDLYHLWFYGAVPVVLIAALLAAGLWGMLAGPRRWAVPGLALLVLAAMLSAQPLEQIRFPQPDQRTTEVSFPRTGRLNVDPETAAHLEAVLSWAKRVPADEGIWFYPSEAMLYYLTDKPLPVAYLWAYDAPTRAMQERAIAELNTTRPRWLLRSQLTFPIDWIPEGELLPQLSLYIQSNYETVGMLPGATLMRRIKR